MSDCQAYLKAHVDREIQLLKYSRGERDEILLVHLSVLFDLSSSPQGCQEINSDDIPKNETVMVDAYRVFSRPAFPERETRQNLPRAGIET
jgi:hypothetical protein